MFVCLCVCLGYIDTCKICMLAVLCTCALIFNTPMTVSVCGGGGEWMESCSISYPIQFN